MRSHLNPKRYVPLSADPDFRYAVRQWERFSTETKPGSDAPTIMRELDSRFSEPRRAAESALALEVLRVLAAAVGWSMTVGYASTEDEIGRNMLPIINTTARLLKLPETEPPLAETALTVAKSRRGRDTTSVKGQVLRETVPPCWSPRWEQERHLLRSYSFAQLFSGALLNHILALIPVFESNAQTTLAKLKKTQGKQPEYTLQRILEKEARDAVPGLVAVFTRFYEKQSQVEQTSNREREEILTLAMRTEEQKRKARDALFRLMPPKTPKEQFDALASEFGVGDDEVSKSL